LATETVTWHAVAVQVLHVAADLAENIPPAASIKYSGSPALAFTTGAA
jgi:hypothetical protein